ncbi:hypothetical protein [Vreelandella sp. TE19]
MYRLLIVLCIFLAGCTTKLWEEKPERLVSINGFYVNTETNDLVVTTRREAYLFRGQQQLGQALILSREVEFQPEFKHFSLSSSNVVTGVITLKLREETPSAELTNRLAALGFTQNTTTDRYQLIREVRGERYTIEGDLPLQKLENEYQVLMSMPRGPLDTAGRVIATPVTVTFDAATAAVFVPLYALLMLSQGIFGP